MKNQHLLFMLWMVKEFYHINLKYYSVKQDQIYDLKKKLYLLNLNWSHQV